MYQPSPLDIGACVFFCFFFFPLAVEDFVLPPSATHVHYNQDNILDDEMRVFGDMLHVFDPRSCVSATDGEEKPYGRHREISDASERQIQ